MASNYITKVAIVGAGGNSGKFMTEALLNTGKHTVTALARAGSQNKLPAGVNAKIIDYNKPETIVEALKGQEALIITLSGGTPHEVDLSLVQAAGEAGVRWILPNEWGPDSANPDFIKDIAIFQPKEVTRKAIADLGKSSYISVSTGFWYEWSLAIPSAFGIDFSNKTVTLFDEGETKISTSTWPQVGRTIAALLSLPIQAKGTCLESLRNQVIYADSFTVSQKDMLESVFRVTGTTDKDWTITKQSARERYENGVKDMQGGDRIGFVKSLYTRVFFDDGSGDITPKGTLNGVLGLPTEDIDEATQVAIDRSKSSPWS
ncbi:unnamed protein product [Penicillium salamii]|uniref:NmrA-like domain-containing protein n=1 Tax=Penicillium salamii TaxID=1612424 RepID=A0A9W4IRU4_9EURO|nr:unnamed protein product [Penicillium salamii]CAG8331499.1 unnamed protein product [Penicillium salamii]CAG8355337.1 unnamed protein product [Penicillium salamii]CAG8359588.1 unnamed protein product [Penicillium salamii]